MCRNVRWRSLRLMSLRSEYEVDRAPCQTMARSFNINCGIVREKPHPSHCSHEVRNDQQQTDRPQAFQQSLESSSLSYLDRFKLPHYDGVLICSDSEPDRRMAKNFKILVNKLLMLQNGRPPEICMIDEEDSQDTKQSVFLKAEETMNRSTLTFLLLTEDFMRDKWTEVLKDEALLLSISRPCRRGSVIPLDTEPRMSRRYEYPFGLRGTRGLDLWKMLKTHDLREVDVNEIELSDLDEDFCKRLTSLFNRWLGHKQKQQEEELSKWIEEEEEKRRWRYLATCGHPTNNNSNEKTKQLIEKMQKGGISASSAARAVATEGLIDIKNEGNLQLGTNNEQHVHMSEDFSSGRIECG